MTGLDVAFAAVGVLAAASGLLAVTTRHVVHAALWLVVCLGSVAGCYLVLGAEFVALVQLLVYVGAIVVLVLFALMLTRAPIGPNREVSTSRLHRALAAILGAAVTALLGAALLPLAGPARPRVETPSDRLAGQVFGTWVWPFELLSLLLLVALVGALAVSRMVAPEPETPVVAADEPVDAPVGEPTDEPVDAPVGEPTAATVEPATGAAVDAGERA